MLRGKFPYEKKSIRWIALLLIFVDIATFSLMFSINEPGSELFKVVFISFLTLITLLVGITPLFTSHEVHDTYILVVQGWYYRNRIDMADILTIKHVKEGPWSIGIHFLGNSTIYVNGSMKDLVMIELKPVRSRNGKRRRMTRILFDVKDNKGFMRTMGREFDQVIERL